MYRQYRYEVVDKKAKSTGHMHKKHVQNAVFFFELQQNYAVISLGIINWGEGVKRAICLSIFLTVAGPII